MAADWPRYNESMVKLGELLLGLCLLQSWGEELEEMNRGREGTRYRYPNGLIRLQGLLRALFRLPYRQFEGFTLTHCFIRSSYHNTKPITHHY